MNKNHDPKTGRFTSRGGAKRSITVRRGQRDSELQERETSVKLAQTRLRARFRQSISKGDWHGAEMATNARTGLRGLRTRNGRAMLPEGMGVEPRGYAKARARARRDQSHLEIAHSRGRASLRAVSNLRAKAARSQSALDELMRRGRR